MNSVRQTIVFRGATLLDGNGGPPMKDASVVVEGNRIAAVESAPTINLPEKARTIRIDGKTLLPGLIDAHVHLKASGGGAIDPAEFGVQTILANLKSYLLFGVTSIMDMAGNADLHGQKARLASGEWLGPRLFGVMYGITAPGSHPRGLLKRFGLEQHVGGFYPEVDTVAAAKRAIAAVVAGKSDGVKIFHTRSEFPGCNCLDCDKEKLKLDVLHALIEESHAHNLRVFSHVAYPSEAREVIEHGVDVLAHPITHAESGAEEVLRWAAERGVAMHSTLTRVEAYYSLKLDPFRLERLRGRVSDVVLDSIVKTGSVARMRHEQRGVSEDARRIMEITMANVRCAGALGVQIALGTDSGAPGGVHGASVPRELELLTQCGLTPMQALQAGTRNAARVIGQGDALGTIEPGKLADMIVINGDPLRDISVMRNVDLIMKDGNVIEPRSITI